MLFRRQRGGGEKYDRHEQRERDRVPGTVAGLFDMYEREHDNGGVHGERKRLFGEEAVKNHTAEHCADGEIKHSGDAPAEARGYIRPGEAVYYRREDMERDLQHDRALGVLLYLLIYRGRAGDIALEALRGGEEDVLIRMQLHIMRDREPAGQRDHEHHDHHDTYEPLSAFFHA